MHSYLLIAPAKINLYLEIIGDRPDGFHELVMIMQSITLADRLTIEPSDNQKINLRTNSSAIPADETNLAYRAAKLMCDSFPEVYANYGGVNIAIEKNIPIAAGLGGGSADAAAVLVGINLMWELGLTSPELHELAAQLGSDIPFCISGGTAIATGRGEKLDAIKDLDNLWVVLAKYNGLSVSTPWAYQTYRQKYGDTYARDRAEIKARRAQVHSSPIVSAIIKGQGAEIGKLMRNDLEKVVLPAHPQIDKLRAMFAESGVLGTMMSGSGSTVFALCESEASAISIKDQMRSKISNPELSLWVTQLFTGGVHLGN
ncbi:4-(cytidine 5'-diphospho)-2-C-methyl-D-erythritol kinase [Myxosarcina sp. GI1]|uniref:4-(cytidine 5'-diphospho)-2-C-methyl-D-erythritol kinase n=1 Tax=Myxosarcina sp. GI1 TaxID=1541065 RepID=UPI0005673CE7|nr:4-(cytidine 5'-diphospho)-2-C-methyl-D-erythritol kinase [Myxosarcina sp. GI1]